MPHSLNRFIRVFEMLVKEFGTEKGRDVFKKILYGFGEGILIRVPVVLSRHPMHAEYYWNIARGQNPTLFRNVRDQLRADLGAATGTVVFQRIIQILGPGEKVTVPVYKCNRGTCSRDQCGVDLCLWREQRNEQIRQEYHAGAGYEELSLTWKLKIRQIRRIVND